ncbi:MAG: cysteine desulfurase, partial [Planctomycetes bacterium]|nr:cysteine desulfurase [Planctomycetota bacterium]
GNHIITCLTEHPATLNTCKYLESKGLNETTCLPVNPQGQIDLDQLEKAITSKTILISLMAANNEIGTTHPIEEIGKIARRYKVMFHCDATQMLGKSDLDVKTCNIDMLSLSAHKIYGPKGIGALFVRNSYPPAHPTPMLHGGEQERGIRSGTLNVAGIAGLGAACRICRENMPEESRRLKKLTDKLYHGITSRLDQVALNGHPTDKLPNILNLSFAGVEGEGLALAMRDLAVSTGSACNSASMEPSHVLWALNLSNELSQGSIRFSLGRLNTDQEIDFAVNCIVEAVQKLRRISPLYQADNKL